MVRTRAARFIVTSLMGYAFTCFTPLTLHAQLAIQRLEPLSVQVGQSRQLVLFGSGFDGDVRLWTSFPCGITITDTKADRLTCQVQVADGVTPQLGVIIAWSSAGISNPAWLVVDDMATLADQPDNHRAETAQLLTPPVAISGQLDGAEGEFFAVELQAGQRLAVDVLTARVGSTADPMVRIIGPTGRELAFSDDAVNWGADAQVSFIAPAPGRYVVELRESSYRTGLPYLMRVGDFPLLTTCYPLGVQQHATSLCSVLTADGHPAPPVIVQAGAGENAVPVATKYRPDAPFGFCQLRVSPLAEFVEYEPNQDANSATRVPLPCAVNGVIQEADDQDWFEFAAVKGQRWIVRTAARTWGAPTYPYVRIFNAAGTLLVESPVGDTEETTFLFAVPETGTYRLVVEELARRFGPTYAYRLEIDSRPWDVLLKATKESKTVWSVPQDDGALVVDLQCRRYGYEGPIQLVWDKGNLGGEFFQASIPQKANEHRLYWRAGAEVGLHVVRLLASADVDGAPLTSQVQTNSVMTLLNPALIYPPHRQDGLFFVNVTPSSPPLLRWKAERTATTVQAGGGEAQLVLPFERANAEFKEAPIVLVGSLPNGVQLTPKVENDTVNLAIKTTKDLAAGEHRARLALFATFQGRNQLLPLDITIQVKEN